MNKTNFHTHTTFCDGKYTAEQMVQAALDKGFSALGFSGHSYTPFDDGYCMNPEKAKAYRAEIARLKEAYRDRITLYCGIEQDYHGAPLDGDYEYVIGSVHYLEKDGAFLSVDQSAQDFSDIIKHRFGGDFDACATQYFRTVADVCRKTQCDIIGHFDLIAKYMEKLSLCETNAYRKAAKEAVEMLIPYRKPFELNTGAMARVGRPYPYPSPYILSVICELGGEILLSSDCHRAEYLDCYFEQALSLAKEIGFQHVVEWTPNGFVKHTI